MATTTNYGWTTPDDTALVKDGAAAIRSLGSSIDTTTKNLNPSTTLGDIEYRSSTANTNTRLAIGTTGQVLTVSGGVPTWTTISSGGMTLISETVANANTGIDLTSIPGTYKQLLLVWSGIIHSASANTFVCRFNADSGTNYARQFYFMTTSPGFDVGINESTNLGDKTFGNDTTDSGVLNNSMGQILIDNYASTSKYKTYFANYSFNDSGTNLYDYEVNGIYKSTTAITQINIVRTAGSGTISNAADTSIRLYGIS